MKPRCLTSAEQATETRREAELYVHLRIETQAMAPLLAEADVAQAAQTALAARAREHRCRVLAVGGGDDHLHALMSFPPSLPLNQLIRQMQHVSGVAAARALSVLGETDINPASIWSGRYQLDTLSQCDVVGLTAYILQHPDVHLRGEAQPEQERADGAILNGRRPGWNSLVREEGDQYHESPESQSS